jgi:molybdopterin-guanine dinucleotide biosynthesis protein A
MGFAESVGAVAVDCPEADEVFKNRNNFRDLER